MAATNNPPDNEPFTISDALARLADGDALTRAQARRVMDELLGGRSSPAQTGAFLMALRCRGAGAATLAGLVEGMRAASVRIDPRRDAVVDLCGTGGDGAGTFNISTAASIVVASCGVAVAKHGNRAASSRCGSAEVLEALGVPIDLPPDRAQLAIEDLGFAFLFAPQYHPAMKHVGPVRKELRLRTVFNLLGPLASPAGVRRQLIGVFDPEVRAVLADVLRELGSDLVWLVHGDGGLDELSVSGASHVTASGAGGRLEEFSVSPEDAGLVRAPSSELAGGDATVNARMIEAIVAGEKGPRRDVVLLNAAAALVVSGVVSGLREGAELAGAAIDAGDTARLLRDLRSFR